MYVLIESCKNGWEGRARGAFGPNDDWIVAANLRGKARWLLVDEGFVEGEMEGWGGCGFFFFTLLYLPHITYC